MNQCELHGYGRKGQVLQETDGLVGKLAPGPLCRRFGGVVKIVRGALPNRRKIVVSGHGAQGIFLDDLQTPIGVRPVSHGVSQAPNRVKSAFRAGVFNHCVQGLQIRVDIGKDQGTQWGFSTVGI
jgi:hypothetical protein